MSKQELATKGPILDYKEYLKTKEALAQAQKELAEAKQPIEELKGLMEVVRLAYRAMKGLGAEDDVFYGILHPDDLRERTRLSEEAIQQHSAMKIAASMYPSELKLFHEIAEMTDHYFISQDGANHEEAVAMINAKAHLDSQTNTNINVGGPTLEAPQGGPPAKRSLLSRVPVIGKRFG